jgi:hypothetical protein
MTEPEPQETIAKWIKANTEHRQWYICPKCSYQAPRFRDEWVGLTATEIKILRRAANNDREFAELVQAKLKEKNT